MIKKVLSIIFLLVWTTSIHAQFNFHWAFPYYSLRNMSIKNGNSDYLVLTKAKNFNGFPNAENKLWPKTNAFSYATSEGKVKTKNYVFMSTDGTQSIEDIQKLHQKLPKSVIFFIHRETLQWDNDLSIIKTILTERPGWAYGGDPYSVTTPIVRSIRLVFSSQNIILGNQAPGEGVK